MNENNLMERIEILAPAGGMESLIAGVRCGADAVYLGGKAFSARQNAGNFDGAALKEAVAYCHVRGVKVYLAVNTLVADREIEGALLAVQDGLNAGVDALIVQDLGLASCLRRYFPGVPLHASTQMSVMSPAGFCALADLGFVRGVLPRELNRDEIEEISHKTSLDLEAFVHGALCMSVSGQCYMSAMLGSRSGNRGLCAQPCRLPFYVEKEGRRGLSLKDLSLVEKMGDMAGAGVVSFKIEGRMKRPEYVAAAVTACKEAKTGVPAAQTLSALQSVFSRTGFTDGYFTGRLGSHMFGVRGKDDVLSAKAVLGDLARLYQKEKPLVPVCFHFELRQGKQAVLKAEARGKSVFAVSESLPQPAVHKPLTVETVAERLGKCGGTPFYPEQIDVALDDGLILPAAELNGLRRSVLEQLSVQLAAPPAQTYQYRSFTVEKYSYNKKEASDFSWRGVFASYAALPENVSRLSLAFLPLEEAPEHFVRLMEVCAVGVVLPRGMFGNEVEITHKLEKLKRFGVRHVLTGNLGGVKLAEEMGFTVHGDFGLNVFNSHSLAVVRKMGVESQTLSFELTTEQIAGISGGKKGVILYGRLPLMLTRNCPVKNELNCAQCGGKSVLTDRKGIQFPVRCGFGCSEILNSRPVYLADRRREFPVDFGTLLFTTETREEAAEMINRCLAGDSPIGEFTRGLAYRGVE